MSEGLDLTAAVEAGARASWEDWRGRRGERDILPAWEDATGITRRNLREAQMPTVQAAADVIEAQVREQVAREIEAGLPEIDRHALESTLRLGLRTGMKRAAKVARGPKL